MIFMIFRKKNIKCVKNSNFPGKFHIQNEWGFCISLVNRGMVIGFYKSQLFFNLVSSQRCVQKVLKSSFSRLFEVLFSLRIRCSHFQMLIILYTSPWWNDSFPTQLPLIRFSKFNYYQHNKKSNRQASSCLSVQSSHIFKIFILNSRELQHFLLLRCSQVDSDFYCILLNCNILNPKYSFYWTFFGNSFLLFCQHVKQL